MTHACVVLTDLRVWPKSPHSIFWTSPFVMSSVCECEQCNSGICAGLGMGQFRPRDVCPSVATHRHHVEHNTSFLSIISDCYASFYINPLHLPFFCFTLTAPKTPGRRKSDHARLDGRCHQCVPRPPACQPCHARRARQLAA